MRNLKTGKVVCVCGDHVKVRADCLCFEIADLRAENDRLRAVVEAARELAGENSESLAERRHPRLRVVWGRGCDCVDCANGRKLIAALAAEEVDGGL